MQWVEDLIGIAGLRIQRMPSEPDADFGNPANYPYMCVASPSCHDTSTTRAWYEEDADRRQRFYNNVRPLTQQSIQKYVVACITKGRSDISSVLALTRFVAAGIGKAWGSPRAVHTRSDA